MTAAEIDDLEATLGIRLPDEYVEVMQKYPFSEQHFGFEMLMDDVEILKRWNQPDQKRSKKKTKPDARAGHFCIGSDGSELSFFIKPGRDSHGVWYFDIESGEFQKYCDGVSKYVEKCRRIDLGEERLPNDDSTLPEWAKYVYTLSIFVAFILFGYIVYKLARWILEVAGLK